MIIIGYEYELELRILDGSTRDKRLNVAEHGDFITTSGPESWPRTFPYPKWLTFVAGRSDLTEPSGGPSSPWRPEAATWYVIGAAGHLFLNRAADKPPVSPAPVCGAAVPAGPLRMMDRSQGDPVCPGCGEYAYTVRSAQLG